MYASVNKLSHTPTLPDPIKSSFEGFIIKRNDVLCGRGGLSNKHFGNHMFRRIVKVNKLFYQQTERMPLKNLLVISIITAIQKQGGRFVRKEGDTWVEIPHREACIKTSQALREHSSLVGGASETTALASSSKSKALLNERREQPKKSKLVLQVLESSSEASPTESRRIDARPLSSSSSNDEDSGDMNCSQHSAAEVSMEDEDLTPLDISSEADIETFSPEVDEILLNWATFSHEDNELVLTSLTSVR